MPTPHLVDVITPDVTDELVALAWQTFLFIEPIPVDEVQFGSDVLCASIAIGGPWEGTLLLISSHAGAVQAATAALGIDPAELEEADVIDIMGELVNIVGGNLKGVAMGDERGWSLSLPVVSTAQQSVPGSRVLVHRSFMCNGEPLVCTLRETA